MTNFSNEIIPYFLYFILLLFYISIISKKKKESREKFHKFSTSLVDEKKLRSFLLDSERKLKALNELYRDNLIELNLYTQKTSQIANIVNKLTTDDIYEFGKLKNNEIFDDLKLNIIEKFEKKKMEKMLPDIKSADIDTLLQSVDNKIKQKEKI